MANITDSNSRLGSCEVCGNDFAQYTCPRCEIKTCSLNCVKIHKKELDCTGDRDKVGFVPLSKFTNLNLLSDYRFLEDVSRTIDTSKRKYFKISSNFQPRYLLRLQKEALARNTYIQFLPRHFTKRINNTTYFQNDNKSIYWRLELIFYQADNLKIVVENCDENDRLLKILSNYIQLEKCPEAYRKSLKFYHSTGLSGLEVLLQAENVKEKPSFFLLDMTSTLRENLENRLIIEYPVLYVIFKYQKDEFKILDCDTEVNFIQLNRNFSFKPFTYFDTINYSKSISKGDDAATTIHNSTKELQKYFQGEDSDTEIEQIDDKVQIDLMAIKELNIPFYENLT